jgi:hypothetical protein
MAKVPLPERGQPLDVNYLFTLANAINEVAQSISPSSSKYVTIDVPGADRQSVKASEARIIGTYKMIVTDSSRNTGDEESFEYAYPAEFKFKPIAVATIENVGQSNAGENVTVVLKDVGTSKVQGVVKFNETGKVSIAVNILVVGIPL